MKRLLTFDNPREGWAEQAEQLHEMGEDELLIPDVFDDEEFEEYDPV